MRVIIDTWIVKGTYIQGWITFSKPIQNEIDQTDFAQALILKEFTKHLREKKLFWERFNARWIENRFMKWNVQVIPKLPEEEEESLKMELARIAHKTLHKFFDIPTCENHENVSDLPTQESPLLNVREGDQTKPSSDSISEGLGSSGKSD